MADASATLAEILEQILGYTSIDPEVRQSLRCGLTLEEIESQLHNFPFQVPGEVKELYQWHDGLDSDCQLFYYHTFLPLDESLLIYEEYLKEFVENGDDEPTLPIFAFEGEYYAAQCSDEQQDSAPIWFIYHGNEIVYNSLKTMLLAILECYETGAYRPILQEWGVDTTVDEQKVSDIKLKYNLIRQEFLELFRQEFLELFRQESLELSKSFGQEYYAHP